MHLAFHPWVSPLSWLRLRRRDVGPGRARVASPSTGAPRSLARHDVLRLACSQGWEIECLAGSLWITQDGVMRDVILEAGQCFRPDSPRPVLVCALTVACVRMEPAA